PAGQIRLRQVHAAQPPGRPGSPDRRPRRGRRPGPRPALLTATGPPPPQRGRHGLPVVQPDRLAAGAGQRDLAAGVCRPAAPAARRCCSSPTTRSWPAARPTACFACTTAGWPRDAPWEVVPVRLTDILALSLGALYQQKLRTVLTTLGVVSGSFVLVVSLSL